MRRLLLAALACGPLACTALTGLGGAPTLQETADGSPGSPTVTGGNDASNPDTSAFAEAGESDATLLPDAAQATDGEGATDGGNEASLLDADANPDTYVPDAGDPIVPSTAAFVLGGITNDGFILYEDPGHGCYAVSRTGGTPQFVAPAPNEGWDAITMSIQGRVAFVADRNVKPSPPVITLTAWTSGDGPMAIPGSNPLVSSDGTRLAYLATDPPSDASPGQLRLMEVDLDATLSNAITLTSVGLSDFNSLYATGGWFVFANVHLFNGGFSSTVDSYTTGGAKTHLWDYLAVSVAGGETLSPDAQNNHFARPAGGGPIVSLALPADAGAQTYTAKLTPDGSRVVILDTSQNFWSSPTVSANVVPLPHTGALADVASATSGKSGTSITMSPDGSHFLFQDVSATSYVASSTAGNALAIRAVNGAAGTNIHFSSDSRYVIFNAGSALQAAPVDTAVPFQMAFENSCEVGVCWVHARDSKVVYISGGDLWSGDLAAGGSVRLARSVSQFVLDAAGAVVAYQFNDSSASNRSGLFATDVP